MEQVTKGYEPKRVLEIFEQICSIPHGSGNEEQIGLWLCDFAKGLGLEHLRDGAGNVLIRKGASAGYESSPAVMLQGHMDMVCEKNGATEHDFLADGLKLHIKEGRLMAKGTTLGGDDGIALAYMLAILEGDYPHPALECLITTGEETSMVGASAFDYSQINARRIINIDSEEEGYVTMSCAGGCDLHLDLDTDLLPGKGRTLKLELTGLAGGHSGTEIDKHRASSIRIMGRILARLYDDTPFNLCCVSGGNKRNAIPRECTAEIYPLDPSRAIEIIADEEKRIRKELSSFDKKFKIRCKKGLTDAPMFTYKDSSAVINMMTLPSNGVYSVYQNKEGAVRSSSNMGIITTEQGRVRLDIMARSSCESEMDEMILKFKRLAKAIGVSMEIEDRHPGWELNPESRLADLYVDTYNTLYKKEGRSAQKCAIHAGLECGIIVSALGQDADAISIGPDIYDIHTPDEALDINSTERTFRVLLEMLAQLK